MVGLFGLVAVTRAALHSSVEAAALTRAEDIAALAAIDALPDPLPGGTDALASQVVDGERVIAASARLAGEPPMVTARPAPGVTEILDSPVDLGVRVGPKHTRVVTIGVETPSGPVTVMVAATLGDIDHAISMFAKFILLGFPLIVAVVAWVSWITTGRALRPVERMRVEADSISGEALDRRLPVPPGTDEVHRLALTMNRMLDSVEASVEQQRRFVADASHELKSPITAIRVMLDFAEANPEKVDPDQLARDLHYESTRLEHLVGDLLALARFEDDTLHLQRREIDLEDLLHEEALAAQRRSTKLVDTTGAQAVRILGDAEPIRQLLRNLLDNALRHADTTVWIDSESADGTAVITISDDGPGIPPGESEQVFGRFVRLEKHRSRGEGGTGLGLAVCRAICRAHGGDVAVIDPTHGGATLEVRLPLPPPGVESQDFLPC